jgi:hypothetical protein
MRAALHVLAKVAAQYPSIEKRRRSEDRAENKN